MEIKINVDDYISEVEKEQLCKEAFKEACESKFTSDLEINRILGNLGYEVIFDLVDQMIGKDSKKLIAERVKDSLEEGKWSDFYLFRRADAWEKRNSRAQDVMDEAVEQNKELIHQRVKQCLEEMDLDKQLTEDLINDSITRVILEKLTKKD